MRWSKCSWYSKLYDASCHKCQRGRLVERCLVSGRGISVYDYRARDVYVWLLDKLSKGCLCMITGQGMCMYDYWTSWARDACLRLQGKGRLCVITGQAGQGVSVYDYWTRDACLRLQGKGRLCVITGQAGQGLSVIIATGISVYDKWAWDLCERQQYSTFCVNDSSTAHFVWTTAVQHILCERQQYSTFRWGLKGKFWNWLQQWQCFVRFWLRAKGGYRRLYDRCMSVCCGLASAAGPFFGFACSLVLQSLQSAVSEARVSLKSMVAFRLFLKTTEPGPILGYSAA